jgi:ABC-type dipeptide/oligopeptide/nickel transport system permease component
VRSPAVRYFAKRILQTAATLLAASVLAFALVPLAPGSPARTILQVEYLPVSEQAVKQLEKQLGLDRPLYVQYVDWLSHAVRGDLSNSYRTQQPVADLVGSRVGPTLLLGSVAFAIALAIAVLGGLVAAAWAGRAPDAATRMVALLGAGVPSFLVGLLLIQYVVLELGVGSVIADGTIRTVWMPALTLALATAAIWSRSMRALLLEGLSAKYSLMATARGASRLRVLLVHALPNAFVPFLGFLGLGIGAIIGGAVIVETVFAWPGMGLLVINSIQLRDLPVIQGFVLISTLAYVLSSLAVDVLAFVLDPRLRARLAPR